MPPTRIAELAERVRESRFGQQVVGPKIAAPLAGWLQENFVESVDESPTPPPEPAPEPEPEVRPEEVEDLDPDEELRASEPHNLLGALKVLSGQVKNHNLVVVAAGIAFWGLLSIPAVLFATVSIAGMVLDADTVKQEVNDNLTGLPTEAREIIGDQLEGVSGADTGSLIIGLVFGLVLALWTSSGAVAKLMAALNTIYGVLETRKFVKLRGTALALTFGGIVFVSSAIFLLAVLPALLGEIDAVGDSAATLFVWLRFPALALVMIVGLGILYHLGPDRDSRYRLFTLGAAVAAVLWIGLSALFSIYTATVGNYNETYGSIGGIVILLMWLFITAFVVLLGAEVHAHMTADD